MSTGARTETPDFEWSSKTSIMVVLSKQSKQFRHRWILQLQGHPKFRSELTTGPEQSSMMPMVSTNAVYTYQWFRDQRTDR